jgi:hypothetical protein
MPAGVMPTWRSASDERFRLIWGAAIGGWKLFDVESDPGETINIVEQQPDYARQLKAAYTTFLSNSERMEGATMQLDPEAEATLSALGYVGDDSTPDGSTDGVRDG